MNIEKFKQAESQYNELKDKHTSGLISAEEMKKQLKSLMMLDDTGRYWMIGGKSGKWYAYNGKEWLEDNPYPALQDQNQDEEVDTSDNPFPNYQASPVAENETEHETDLSEQYHTESQTTTTIDFGKEASSTSESEESSYHFEQALIDSSPQTRSVSTLMPQQTHIDLNPISVNEPSSPTADRSDRVVESVSLKGCPLCSAKNPPYAKHCLHCGANLIEPLTSKPTQSNEIQRMSAPSFLIIRQISLLPCMIFLGGVGSIVGVILGAMFGIFTILDPLNAMFPLMLQEMRGKVLGGLFFAAIGGLAGFLLFALLGAFLVLFYNTVATVFGGLRFKVKTE